MYTNYIRMCQPKTLKPVKDNIFSFSAENKNRTCDTRIFSPLLYLLSYLGIEGRNHSPQANHGENKLKNISLVIQGAFGTPTHSCSGCRSTI